MSDLVISGCNCHINCNCSRWDTDNYTFIIETWMNKSDFIDLKNSVRPGACGELYKIMNNPHFYDSSWQGKNTLIFSPIPDNLLYKLKKETLGFCRNLMSSPEAGDKGHIWCKIECYRSGSTSL